MGTAVRGSSQGGADVTTKDCRPTVEIPGDRAIRDAVGPPGGQWWPFWIWQPGGASASTDSNMAVRSWGGSAQID